VTLLLLSAPVSARAEGAGSTLWTVYEGAADLLVSRPLGAVQLTVGAVAYVLYGPVDLVWPEDLDAFRVCVEDPYERLFFRPVGEL
jgi:hypothetical protein